MRKALIALSVVVALVGAAPALAQGDIVLIEIDTVVRGNEGDIREVARVDVDPELVGATCTGTARTQNNASEHPNNDFILASGTSTAVIPDYEAVAGAITSMTTPLVLGETIVVSILLGPDRVASQMVRITLNCQAVVQPPPETTTTAPPATTTTAPPETTTTAPPATTTTSPPDATTTTEEPPEGGIEAGGGSTVRSAGDAAAWWVGAGMLALLAALVVVTAARRRLSSEE